MSSSSNLASLSTNLVYSAIGVYALAMLAYAARSALIVFMTRSRLLATRAARSPAVDRDLMTTTEPGSDVSAAPGDTTGAVATSLTNLGSLLLSGAVLSRGLAAGRVPWGNMYEFALVASLVASIGYLVVLRRHPLLDLGAWLVGLVTLTLGLGVTVLYVPNGDLIPVLDSYWLVIHVAAAITCAGLFTVGAATLVLYLFQSRRERSAVGSTRSALVVRTRPSAEDLDRIAYGIHVFAFPLWTFAVIAGAIWAENSWGRYWGWDPKETWAFITWVFYAAYLHAQATPSLRGRRAAVLGLLGYAAILFNFIGVNIWISGLHSYAGI